MKYQFIVMCATAMSSGLVAQKMKDEAGRRGIELEATCFSSFQYKQADFSGVNLILLAPQIKGQRAEIAQYIAERGWKTGVMTIDMQDYGLIRGAVILDKALKEIAGAGNE